LGGIFIAISGPGANGHDYIPALIEKGICQWIITEDNWAEYLSGLEGHNWILVKNSQAALQQMAAWHRSLFGLQVVGITGSNGKTIVKEWLAQLLSPAELVVKSPKSFNSQIGVPVSVWNIAAGHTIGIFEAGISRPGEMEQLQKIIRPQTGIFTNLGSAHDEGFSSRKEKLEEKLKLFRNCTYLIVSQDFLDVWRATLQRLLPAVEMLAWQFGPNETWFNFNGATYPVDLPYHDKASKENLGHAIASALFLGTEFGHIQQQLPTLGTPEMRLGIKEGQAGVTIIDDSYTNDPAGLEAALQFAKQQQHQDRPLFLVLSDLEQTILNTPQIQAFIDAQLQLYHICKVLLVGEQWHGFIPNAKCSISHFKNVDELLQNVDIKEFESGLLLIKGARRFQFERLVKAWQKRLHGTRLETDLEAMVQNLKFYRSLLPKGTGLMAMVKALGYGSGGEELARVLEYHRVDYLAVAYADEGIRLRLAGIKLPIMVMNPMPEALPGMILHQLEPEIYNQFIFNAYLVAVRNLPDMEIPAIHLKIDTGMHRLGFLSSEIPALADLLQTHPELRIATVFSHLAGADDANLESFTNQQIEEFQSVCTYLETRVNRPFKKHILNSAGILRHPHATMDMVRLGIGLYGIEVNAWYQNQLLPVSKLKTTISQIKHLKAGESVGYGRKGIVTRNSAIATIAIGYADGFRRDFSGGKAQVKINGQWAPVVGNVCMDMTMVDVTEIDCAEGDEVVIFDDVNALLQLAAAAETIPYEILTGIGHRVKRIFFKS